MDGRTDGAHLAPSGLDHELSGQVGGRLGLQRPDHHALVQWVTRDDLQENNGLNLAAGKCYSPVGTVMAIIYLLSKIMIIKKRKHFFI